MVGPAPKEQTVVNPDDFKVTKVDGKIIQIDSSPVFKPLMENFKKNKGNLEKDGYILIWVWKRAFVGKCHRRNPAMKLSKELFKSYRVCAQIYFEDKWVDYDLSIHGEDPYYLSRIVLKAKLPKIMEPSEFKKRIREVISTKDGDGNYKKVKYDEDKIRKDLLHAFEVGTPHRSLKDHVVLAHMKYGEKEPNLFAVKKRIARELFEGSGYIVTQFNDGLTCLLITTK